MDSLSNGIRLFAVVVFLTQSVCAQTLQDRRLVKSVPDCVPDVNGAKDNDTVTVHYTGKLQSNGKQFDSSVGSEPISFELGSGLVIKGWEIGIQGLCPGEKVELDIPASLGYGEAGAGDAIPPNADLNFVIEMIDIKRELHEEILEAHPCAKSEKSRDQDFVTFKYVGRLPNGTIWGETTHVEDGGQGPIEREIGTTGIKGWDLALAGMCEDEVKRVYIPPRLAYGEEGVPGIIPPNSVIVLDIKLLAIKDRQLSFLLKAAAGTAFSG